MFWYSIWTREHVRTTIRPEAPKTPSSGIKIISICLTWMIAHRAWPNESCSSGCLFLDRVSSRWGGVWSGSLSDPNVVLDWRKRALTHTDDRQCSMSRRPFLKGGECVVGKVYADARFLKRSLHDRLQGLPGWNPQVQAAQAHGARRPAKTWIKR